MLYSSSVVEHEILMLISSTSISEQYKYKWKCRNCNTATYHVRYIEIQGHTSNQFSCLRYKALNQNTRLYRTSYCDEAGKAWSGVFGTRIIRLNIFGLWTIRSTSPSLEVSMFSLAAYTSRKKHDDSDSFSSDEDDHLIGISQCIKSMNVYGNICTYCNFFYLYE